MHLKKSVLISFFFSFAVFFLISPLTYANLCPTSSPQDSKIFSDFKKVLRTEYFSKSSSGDEHLLGGITSWQMIGHALGRLAFAVQGQPDRRAAFDCVQLGLEQIIAFKELRTPEEQGQLFRIMMQAGYGMYDKEVARLLKGALPTEPLYDVLGGTIKTPSPSKGTGSAGGGTSPSTTLKDPARNPVAVAGGGASSGGKVAGAGSSEGHCSNWMTMSFSDSTGNLASGDTEKACAVTGKSGDFITRINPVTKACSICSRDDWTPPSPPPPPIGTTGGGVAGGAAGGGGTGPGGGSSGKIKCHLYSGYMFSSKPNAEFNVLRATKPDKRGFIEFLYTVATPSKRFNSIEKARKAAKKIVKEGTRGKQYGLAIQVTGADAFCNFIESQCDMKISSVNLARKGCKWEK